MKVVSTEVLWTEEAVIDAALYGVLDRHIDSIVFYLKRDPFAGEVVGDNIRRVRKWGNDYSFHCWVHAGGIRLTIIEIRPAGDLDRENRRVSSEKAYRRAMAIVKKVAGYLLK